MVSAAVELFNARGYEATSMGDLAAALSVSKSALYHHVTGKEQLLAAALEEALGSLRRALEAAEAGDDVDPLGRLRAALHGAVTALAEHRPAVTLLLRVRGNSAVEAAAMAERRALDERFAALVRAAADAGRLRDDLEPDLVARLAFGTVNSLVEWWRPGGPLDGPRLADAVTSYVLDGLAPPAPPSV